MSTDQHRRAVEQHQKAIARFQQEKAQVVAKAVTESKRANDARAAAARSGNASVAASKSRDAIRHEQEASKLQGKVAELEKKIAGEQTRLNESIRRLESAGKQEDKKRIQVQKRTEQANQRSITSIQGTLSQHAQMHRLALTTLARMKQPPEQVTVLFLAANPVDQPQLRLDEEVRAIGEMIRKSEHRDAVRLESRWAVRPLDLLQAINECRPQVVHFSGHGSDLDEIVFQDDSGNAKFVSKEAIVQTLAAASDEIQLVFFNTCYSRQQAASVVEHIAAAIGMNTSIGDEAARTFAAQFYSAIGFGLSLEKAFRQAKAALLLESIPEEHTPELFTTDGLSPDNIVLVRSPDRLSPSTPGITRLPGPLFAQHSDPLP